MNILQQLENKPLLKFIISVFTITLCITIIFLTICTALAVPFVLLEDSILSIFLYMITLPVGVTIISLMAKLILHIMKINKWSFQ